MPFQPSNVELYWRGINDLPVYRSLGFGEGYALSQVTTTTRPAVAQLTNYTQLMVWRGPGTADGMIWSINKDFTSTLGQPGWGYGPGATSWTPSITPWKQGAALAWIGVGSDNRIWTSNYGMGGNPWSPQALAALTQHNNEPITTASSPAIASDPDGNILMVWRGPNNDDSLYSATSTDGKNFTNFTQIPRSASSTEPALAYFTNGFVLAFKGGQDTGIYSIVKPSIEDAWNETSFQTVGQVGTSDGPCLIAADGMLVMAWKGVPGDNDLYYSMNSTGSPYEWSNQSVIQQSGSSLGPAGYYYRTAPPVL